MSGNDQVADCVSQGGEASCESVFYGMAGAIVIAFVVAVVAMVRLPG